MIPTKPINSIWTDEQWQAIYQTGSNILVSAGAGSGKTAVLTERLKEKIKNGTSLKNLIVLTFTNDAAATMRDRLRSSLKDEYDVNKDPYILEQLELIDVSNIQTFDSFAGEIVKKYHYLIDLPKKVNMIDDHYLLMKKNQFIKETLDDLVSNNDIDTINLIKNYSVKDNDCIIDTINEIINKRELIVDYYPGYFVDKLNKESVDSFMKDYRMTVCEKIKLLEKQMEILENISLSSEILSEHYQKFSEYMSDLFIYKNHIASFELVLMCDSLSKNAPTLKGAKEEVGYEAYSKQLKKIKEDKKSIKDIVIISEEEYINEFLSTKPYVSTFEKISNIVVNKIDNFKKINNLYSFMDICVFASKIISNNESIRNELRNNTKEILIDEYQDTSDIQERIIQMIGNNNIYMVGDIKQSIYRFRNANPELFTSKMDAYSRGNGGILINLMKNFRSRETVLNDVNYLFKNIMTKDYGGVDYDESQKLRFGNKKYIPNGTNHELSILEYDKDFFSKYTKAEIEAFIIGYDILSKVNKYQLLKGTATFKDFAVLCSSKTNFDVTEKVFKYLGIPVFRTESASFIKSEEIVFVMNILKCSYSINNYDYYNKYYKSSLISILRSFIIEMDDNLIHELYLSTDFDLNKYNEELNKLIIKYSFMFDNTSIYEIIKTIYNDFNIYYQLIKLGNVEERENRLRFLLNKASEFANFDNIEFIEYLEQVYNGTKDIEMESSESDVDAVIFTTMHKSKGLQYPICYFPNLDRRFNLQDLHAPILCNQKYGIVSKIMDYKPKDSFVKTLIKFENLHEEISERIRLFYVALTRAQEQLIMVMPMLPESNSKIIEDSKSIYDFICSVSEIYDGYIHRELIGNELNITKEYLNLNIKDIPDVENNKEYISIIQPYTDEKYTRPSKSMLHLLTKEQKEIIEKGKLFHSVLENVSVKNAKLAYYDSYLEYNIVRKFLDNPFIKSLEIENEYHEYTYFDSNGNKAIIDLILETRNDLYIIDYKLSNTDDENYINQLNKYKEYLESISNKVVHIYLYSIFKNAFKELN